MVNVHLGNDTVAFFQEGLVLLVDGHQGFVGDGFAAVFLDFIGKLVNDVASNHDFLRVVVDMVDKDQDVALVEIDFVVLFESDA